MVDETATRASRPPQPSEPPSEGLRAWLPVGRRAMGAYLRATLALVWLATSLVHLSPSLGTPLVPLGFLLFSLLCLLWMRRRELPVAASFAVIAVDVGVVTLGVWLHGSGVSGLATMYVLVVAAHSLDHRRWPGAAAVALSTAAYIALTGLEEEGIIPRAPLAPADLAPGVNPLGTVTAVWVIVIAMVAIHFFLAHAIRQIERHAEAERNLLAAERLAAERSAKLKKQFEEVQRLESLGRLSGGIAHDFNNLLTGILVNARYMRDQIGAGDPRREDLDDIIYAAERAAELTAQLLAFGRKQMASPEAVDVNRTVGGFERALRRIVGEAIQLRLSLSSQDGRVKIDPSQMEQLFMHLAVHARDTMRGGGTLSIETADAVLDEAFCAEHLGALPGRHVAITVSDTGPGLDETDRAKLFEPFFTPKNGTRSTGLGLAMVYGVVKQSGGTIDVRSEPDMGTTFKIYLPGTDEPLPTPDPLPSAAIPGNETILLVEDEDVVRQSVARLLGRYGYQVITAENGEQALRAAAEHGGPIHLLLTDIVMPGALGPDIARELVAARPGLRVIFMSGYAEREALDAGFALEGAAFIQKPFANEKLLEKLHAALR